MSYNEIIIAAAGSGKTTHIVKETENIKGKILLLTYTNENLREIRNKVIEKYGIVPNNIKLHTWYEFLLSNGVRPYQSFVYDRKRIESIFYTQGKSTIFVAKTCNKYFIKGANNERNRDNFFS